MDTLLITLISLFSNLISQIQNFPIQNQQSLNYQCPVITVFLLTSHYLYYLHTMTATNCTIHKFVR
jgi:hypothetical protein